jgi:Pregnancy-associated plasma protein-A
MIDVFAHVLRSKQGGGVPEHRVQRQIDVLNTAFAGEQSAAAADTPFRFRLADVDVTVNGRWSRMDEGTQAESRAKRTLHRGGATDLNLYIGRNRSGSLGWGTQPTRLDSAPMLDGVVIARHTLPGGSGGHYSAGDAAVHETGHWLGLFHTFAGKCGGSGDLVADTPREGRPSYECPVRRDTCAAPGRDPVHNFMDYSYDSCMNQFTTGQAARMRHAWAALRAAAGVSGSPTD